MEVLVFANPKDVSKERFFQIISKASALSPKFVFEHGRFKSHIMKKTLDRRAIVFFAYDQDDLTLAISLKEYMAGARLILILHTVNTMTVKQGLSISPCFIAYAESDFSDIVSILKKISTIVK